MVGNIVIPADSDWTVVRTVSVCRRGSKYLCRCKCGAEKQVWGYSLKSGASKRCKSCAARARAARSGKHERNRLIVAAVLSGIPKVAVAREYKISPQRVASIVSQNPDQQGKS